MPAIDLSDPHRLVGKFLMTPSGLGWCVEVQPEREQALVVIEIDGTEMRGWIDYATLLTEEVVEADFSDIEVVEKFLAGEPFLPEVPRRDQMMASAEPCPCGCGHSGGCYRLGRAVITERGTLSIRRRPHDVEFTLGPHMTNSAFLCGCEVNGCHCTDPRPF